MVGRIHSDEYYVLNLCDETLGSAGHRQARFEWLRGDPSPGRTRGRPLPVDGYWPELGLVVEFQEEQQTQSIPFIDRRQTVSGVSRGEQRRIYDGRKRKLIPEQGLRLVVIEKSAFVVKSKRIDRSDRARDLEVVREHLDAR